MISVILPTFNSIKFLEDRVDSILNQTYSDWECVVVDGFSKDGTWEYLLHYKTDSRFRFYQFPAKGVYDAWNKGIELATGEFIYFATSDDTMSPDCLERLRVALQRNPNCGIAQCGLRIIDDKNDSVPEMDWDTFPAQQFFKDYLSTPHIRKAPLTGLLYCTHQSIIHSFTQILIRKSVFKTIGNFLTDVGPIADFGWGMRAGLSTDIITIPNKLATWRYYSGQATSVDSFNTPRYKRELANLIKLAIGKCASSFKISLLKNISLCSLWLLNDERFLQKRAKKSYRLNYVWAFFYSRFLGKKMRNRSTFFDFLYHKITGDSPEDFVLTKKF